LFLQKLKDRILLFDGGMGTELYRRGVFIDKCFDELNITNPDMVTQVHRDYINAGADIIETNTFSANRFKLRRYHLEDKLYDINFNGARIARESAEGNVLIAGAIGPLGVQIEPLGPTSRNEAQQFYTEQLKPLIDGGIDLILFETFIYTDDLRQAVNAARSISELPIIAQVTISEDGSSLTGGELESVVEELNTIPADVIGINCTVGPQVMLNWLERARPLTDKPISIMPNAGKPKNIDGRNIYLASPEYFGEYARHFIRAGANIIGGCCGTGPEHIQKMRNSISALSPQIKSKKLEISSALIREEVKVVPRDKKSRLAKRLADQRFVTFVELISPHGVDAGIEIDRARELFYYGIDVINIPDGPRASARMSALSLAVQIQKEAGIETVLHYACRDRNVIGIQSDLLGAYALGIRNILAITGDPPKLGNYPDATAVFDVDSIGLVNIINRLNHALDIAGNPIRTPAAFFTGVGANPGAINLDEEIRRLDWKVEAGAEYIVTQPVFDLKIFETFLKRTEHIKLPLIAGIWPLTSIRNAEFMNNEVPGCDVPESIMKRLRAVSDSKEDSRAEGIKIAREIFNEILPNIRGIQISAPFGNIKSVFDVLDGII
jgi:methionine synthase / methylenetetrahydrofolate reductase(NADPH)